MISRHSIILMVFALFALQSAYGTPLFLLPERLKTNFCAALLGVGNNLEKKAPLNPTVADEVLVRLYPGLWIFDNKDRGTFSSSSRIYSRSNQTYLHSLKNLLGGGYNEILPHFFMPESNTSIDQQGAAAPVDRTPINAAEQITLRKTDSSARVRTIAKAEIWARHYGIVQTRNFRQLPENIRLELLNEVFQETRKVPARMKEAIRRAGKRLDLVIGNVTDHPDLSHLRGVTPRGWLNGSTWDTVSGLSHYDGTVIAADSLIEGHVSVNLILHEHAHTFDMAVAELGSRLRLSHQNDFLAIHSRTNWKSSYERFFPAEAFAESVARFLHNERTKQDLKEEYPEIHEYLRQLLGGSSE